MVTVKCVMVGISEEGRIYCCLKKRYYYGSFGSTLYILQTQASVLYFSIEHEFTPLFQQVCTDEGLGWGLESVDVKVV